MVYAGVFFALDLAFWHTGIKITTATNAALLANLTPIPVAVAAFFLFGEAITKRFVFACALALSGALFLASANLQFAPERIKGDIMSALASCWYAAYFLAVRAARQAGASSIQVLFWSTLIASLVALLIALRSTDAILPKNPQDLWILLALAILIHVCGQGAIAVGLGYIPAALAAILALVQPVVAAFAGWIILGETLYPVQWLGVGLILIGIYVAQNKLPNDKTAHKTS